MPEIAPADLAGDDLERLVNEVFAGFVFAPEPPSMERVRAFVEGKLKEDPPTLSPFAVHPRDGRVWIYGHVDELVNALMADLLGAPPAEVQAAVEEVLAQEPPELSDAQMEAFIKGQMADREDGS